MNDKYILEGQTPVACPDLMVWEKWMQDAMRHVAKTEEGEVKVSTVFLGLDHAYAPNEPRKLFETMIFGGPHDGYQERCSTWGEAEGMHRAACELAFGASAAAPPSKE